MAFLLAGCTRPVGGPLPEDPEELLTSVAMSNPRGLVQLTHGFWKLEGGAWRWTSRSFGVVLRVPPQTTPGATLAFHFTLPQTVLDHVRTVQLKATVNGQPLTSEVYTTGGDYTYKRTVPPELLAGGTVSIEFSTDNALQAGDGDSRELALVAREIGFLAQ